MRFSGFSICFKQEVPMRKAGRWLFLPAIQVALAIVLSLIGKVQTEQKLAGGVQVWDYIAPAEILLHSINYPAAVATGLTLRRHTFQIGLEYSALGFLLYLIYVAGCWLVVLWCLSNYRLGTRTARPVPVWPSVIGTMAGAFLLFTFLAMLRGPYAFLLVASSFCWSIFFLVTFPLVLVQRFRRTERRT
jgi:hypothetical protein